MSSIARRASATSRPREDPDADPDEAAAQFDRDHAQVGATGDGTADTTGTTADGTSDDQRVEHYEHTSEPGVESRA